jgi:Glyoxalase-like domain
MASGRAIDHVVLTVRNLDRAAATYQKLDFTLTPRALHEDRMGRQIGSHNSAGGTSSSCSKLIGQKDLSDMTSRHRRRSSASATTTDWPCGSVKACPCWSSQAMTPERIIAGSRPPVSRPLHRSTSRDAPNCPTAHRSPLRSHLPLCNPQRCRRLHSSFARTGLRTIWKPEYQSHANGATGIVAIYLSSPAPERDAAFVSKMFGGEVSSIPGGCNVACGPSQQLRVLTPQAIGERDSSVAGVELARLFLPASLWPLTQDAG